MGYGLGAAGGLNMSAKWRMVLWFTLMMLVLAGVTLTFVLVMNGSVIANPASQVVKVVSKRADKMEYDNGEFDTHEMKEYKRSVYCSYYNENGERVRGAVPFEGGVDLPFLAGEVRSYTAEDHDWLVYDSYVDESAAGLWIRGVISADAAAGPGRVILPLTWSLLPVLLLLSIGGGWLIARDSFLPLERITEAAGSISDGDDLSARLNLRRGPREMRRLARTFDGMFARLETSFLSKKQFTADASHELRTPVAVILAECDRAKRKAETKEDFLASINVIEQQGNKMNTLIEQLLSLTRIQQGTEKYPLRVCDLSGFVDACCDEFVPADERGMTLETDIEPGVEAAYNPSLLSRAMFNLMQNAYKYGREGGHIRVSLSRENGSAVISVKDDGPGIPKAEQEKIWQRFYRCDASRAEGGTGLGLSLVREIALVHHARAEVVSEPGQGCDFRIVLPPVKK